MLHYIYDGLYGLNNLAKNQGANAPNAKLTNEQVAEIKAQLLRGQKKNIDIAKEFNVNPTLISAIKCHKTWRCIKVKMLQLVNTYKM